MIIRLGVLVTLLFVSCAKERPYLSGHIKRANDAVMVPCDPYGLGVNHQCIVFSAAFRENLYVYDATAGEMVLSPMSYFPLKIRVGRSTDHLVPVMSADKKVPFLLALDRDEGEVYPVRLFPHKKERSFAKPNPQKWTKPPWKMAAVDLEDKIIALGTHPDDGTVEMTSFDRVTGTRDGKARSFKVGTRPNAIAIDREGKFAVVSDDNESSLHVLHLANIDAVLTKNETPTLKSISITTAVDRIYLSRRDFGMGTQLYAVVLGASGNDVALVNIDKDRVEGGIVLDEFPMAAYFPDDKSARCCSKKPHWFSAVTIKGMLNYVVINSEGSTLKLEKSTVTDLTAESNLALGKLHVRTILGGYIKPDPKIDREVLCQNHRQTFYIAAYGNSRSYLNVEPVEVEAHGYSCEGEASASRFGYKAN